MIRFKPLLTAALLGSASLAAHGANAAMLGTPIGAAAQTVNFSVALPLQNQQALQTLLADQQNASSPSYHKWLSPSDFNARFGPSSDSVARVTAALQARGLQVVEQQGSVLNVSGTTSTVARAFATSLTSVASPDGRTHLLATSPLTLPDALKSEGVTISAFNGPPRSHKHSQISTAMPANPDNRYGAAGPYWFTDLKQAYDYPSYQSLDGTGVNVAILITNDVLDSDIAAMFNHENFTAITGKAVPTINRVLINGGAPFDVNDSFEASLDVQQVLGGAPGAKVTLVNIPTLSDANILAGYSYIVNAKDPVTPTKALYQLVNSSFGGCEALQNPTYTASLSALFAQGNAEGITFVASSGDSAGLGCPDANYVAAFNGMAPTSPPRFVPGIETPSSDPNVTAVGGGNLLTNISSASNPDSSYVGENALGDPEYPYDPYGVGLNVSGGYWGAGGGVSTLFAKPSYQNLVNSGSATKRTVPDVGMQVGGCPGGISYTPCGPNRSSVLVYDGNGAGGGLYGVIGTSVSSPEFVGALALYVQRNGPQGNVNTYLYTKGAAQTAGNGTFYHRAIQGFDGKYTQNQPSINYNYLVGNGTPDVRALFNMTDLPAAGVPKTATNP